MLAGARRRGHRVLRCRSRCGYVAVAASEVISAPTVCLVEPSHLGFAASDIGMVDAALAAPGSLERVRIHVMGHSENRKRLAWSHDGPVSLLLVYMPGGTRRSPSGSIAQGAVVFQSSSATTS